MLLNKTDLTSESDQKNGKLPAYRELALALKDKIASGEYPLGSRIPSEIKISRAYKLSTMTVRQAVGVLVQAGLLERIQGSGTYVTTPLWTQASFAWSNLGRILKDRKNISLCIFKAGLVSPGPKTSDHLRLEPHSQVIFMDRLIRYKSQPILLNHSVLKFDPMAPLIEAELETIALNNVSSGLAQKYIKKSQIWVTPVSMTQVESEKLETDPGDSSLKISYTLYDYQDVPLGSGWFLAPRKMARLSARLGFWT
ncbi:MAG: GntR family transcriptional regulator [Deltaproteobacteria bacterium]|jgi:DNA-binding GntR family transcriptional regulator|nr:GntR family transcriptional regulator [Deltaproteobacteria bacterium]